MTEPLPVRPAPVQSIPVLWDREHRIPGPPASRGYVFAVTGEDFAWFALYGDPAVVSVTVLDNVPTVGNVTLELDGGSPAAVLTALDGMTPGGLGVHVRNRA